MRRLVAALALVTSACDRGARPDAAPVASVPSVPSVASAASVASVASVAPTPPASVAPAPPAKAARAPLERVEIVKGGAATDALPMIVALHGLGDDARSFAAVFDGLDGPARVIVLQAPTRHGPGWSWFATRRGAGSVTVHADGITAAAALIADEVRALVAARPTRGKPVVTGFSQGGMLSFALALGHGELFARAVPIAGWLPEALWPASAPPGAAPIVALHGDADDVLPIGPTRAGVAHLVKLGMRVELREYAGVRHTIGRDERRALFALLHQ